jgi:ABC-type multidrug transport system ATPase subunit
MIHLSVISLEKKFGIKTVFTGLDFSIQSCVLGIAGTNGSGKSTLLKCISGLLKPTKGRADWQIDGEPVGRTAIKKHLGYVAPYVELYEELSVTENLEFIKNLRELKMQNNIPAILETFEALKLADQPFGSLSTGQRQRIKLAAALIHQPRILVLDEPGSNLDGKGKRAVRQLVDKYRNEQSMVLLASNMTEELDLCDEIIELNPTE